MKRRRTFQNLPSIFSESLIAEKPTISNVYASPMFQSILSEHSVGDPRYKLVTRSEFNKVQEKNHILRNICAFKKEYGLERDFFKQPANNNKYSTLKRMTGGTDEDRWVCIIFFHFFVVIYIVLRVMSF